MITRAQMQRQLRNKGGMTVSSIRQKYGLGSLVRKLIPNEIARIAEVAAPIAAVVAPQFALPAAIVGGLGRYDRTGDLGSSALYGGAVGLGGMASQKFGFGGPDSFLSRRGIGGGIGFKESARNVLLGKPMGERGLPGKGLFGAGGDFSIKGIGEAIGKGTPGVFLGTTALALLGQKLVGPKKEDETEGEYLQRRKTAVGGYLRKYYSQLNPTASATDVESFVQRNLVEYKAEGGRMGYAEGTPQEMFPDNIDNIGPRKSAPRLRKMPEFKGNEVKPSDMMMAGPVLPPDPTQPVNPFGPKPGDFGIEEDIPIKIASNIENDKILEALFEKYIDMGLSPKDAAEAAQKEFDRMSMMKMKDRTMADKGGVMGIPVRMNSEGIKELDMRKTGGFVPIGVKEKADDVPAMLSKNEFVMTADAVRAAGGGSIQKGAQRMYDTMKRLESRVA